MWWTNREKCFYCPAPGAQRVNGLICSSDGRHVPSRWAKSWHWRKEEKQQSQEVKNWGIREIHHHSTSLTLCRAWPYQAAGLSEWRNQVVGRAARPALVWEHVQPWLHQSSWYMCIKSALKCGNFTFLFSFSCFAHRWHREDTGQTEKWGMRYLVYTEQIHKLEKKKKNKNDRFCVIY